MNQGSERTCISCVQLYRGRYTPEALGFCCKHKEVVLRDKTCDDYFYKAWARTTPKENRAI